MPLGPEIPPMAVLHAIADRHGFDLDGPTLETYRALFQGTIADCRHLDGLPERKPEVRYPRTPGSRPEPDANPLNGWAWRCSIEGADAGILQGHRVGVKDSICVAGVPMRNGSKLLEGYVPDVDAAVVTRVLEAGGIIVGKTNCEDLCLSGAGYTSALGPVGNVFDDTRNSGSSSSGSAAVIAAGEVDLAIGGDQGGSIRIPASWSGVYGLKPTYGLVPYTGCAMLEATLDHVGPMASSTAGLTRLLQAMAGPDPLDPRQRGIIPDGFDFDFLSRMNEGIAGKKIAVVREGFAQDGNDVGFPPSDPLVDAKVRAAIQALEDLGAIVEDISIPMHLSAYHLWSVILTMGSGEFMLNGSGLGSNWQGFYNTGLAETFGRAVRSRPNEMPSPAILTVLINEALKEQHGGRYYWKAQNQRHLVVDAYDAALRSFDMLAMPTTPFTATKRVGSTAPLGLYIAASVNMLRNTCVANLTGHPSISLPCGMANGLPVGLMLTGRRLDDIALLQASAAFEAWGDWKTM